MDRSNGDVDTVASSETNVEKTKSDLAITTRSLTRPATLPSRVSSSTPSDHDGEEPYREEETDDRRKFPYMPRGWGGTWAIWPFGASREETRYEEETYEDASDSPHDEDSHESLWDASLITLLLVGGVILFLFPEPVTSAIGIFLISMGVIGWLIDWAL